jgi:hypothetical protein
MQPRRVDAYWIFMPVNICDAKRGKAAPHKLRKKVFAAMAEAAN